MRYAHPPRPQNNKTIFFFILVTAVLTLRHHTESVLLPAPLTYTLLGSISGGAGALVVYPIDYVKSQLQTSSGRAKYKSGIDAFVKIFESEGPLIFYSGALVQVAGIAPEKTIKLGVNDAVSDAIISSLKHNGNVLGGFHPPWVELISGSCAGLCQVLITNPLEVVKVKIQTSQGKVNLSELWKEIGKDGILDGLYKGTSACIARDVIFNGLLFPLYTFNRAFIPVLLGVDTATTASSSAILIGALAGGLAAIPAAILATPADTIKTRMQQSQKVMEDTGDIDYSKMSLLTAARTLIADEGVSVLFSGTWERVIRSIPQFAVTLALFDFLKGLALQYGLLV